VTDRPGQQKIAFDVAREKEKKRKKRLANGGRQKTIDKLEARKQSAVYPFDREGVPRSKKLRQGRGSGEKGGRKRSPAPPSVEKKIRGTVRFLESHGRRKEGRHGVLGMGKRRV